MAADNSSPQDVVLPLISAPGSTTLSPFRSVAPRSASPHRALRAALALSLIAIVFGLHLWTLMQTPPAFVDEAWNASRSWSMLHTGRAFGSLDAGVFEQYDGYWTYFPWLGTALHVPFLALLGPSLFAMRLASLTFGLLLVLLVFAVGKRFYSTRIGIIAAALLSFSSSFALSAHMARHDIMVATFGVGALALYASGRGSASYLTSLASGLLVGLSLDVHLYAAIYLPAITALYLADARDRGFPAALRDGRLWSYIVGAGLGVAFFLVIHVIPYPRTIFTLYNLGNGSSHTPPLLGAGPLAWVQSALGALLMPGLTIALLSVLAFAALFVRRATPDKRLVTLFTLLMFATALVIRNKVPQYSILVTPFACLLVASYLGGLIDRGWRVPRLQFAQVALAGALFAASTAIGVHSLQPTGASGEFDLVVSHIREVMPPNANAIGTQTFWFARPDARYLSWDQILFYRRLVPGSSVEDALRVLHSDYFVLDGWLDLFITDDPARLAKEKDTVALPKSELVDLLARRGTLLTSMQTSNFGEVRVYKINWGR